MKPVAMMVRPRVATWLSSLARSGERPDQMLPQADVAAVDDEEMRDRQPGRRVALPLASVKRQSLAQCSATPRVNSVSATAMMKVMLL